MNVAQASSLCQQIGHYPQITQIFLDTGLANVWSPLSLRRSGLGAFNLDNISCEPVYQEALELEFGDRGIPFRPQAAMPVF
jgi:hypothetical protein